MDDFYVYKHVRKNDPNQKPFYIGLGRNKRAFQKKGRNDFWKNITDKNGYNIEFVAKGISQKTAQEIEKCLIRCGHSLGFCEANLQDGGGVTNHSPSTRRKIANSLKGKKHSRDRRLAIARAKGAKPFNVFDKTGIFIGFWESQAECSRNLKINISDICCCLKGTQKTAKGYIFKFKELE